jgi:DNA polymerase-1
MASIAQPDDLNNLLMADAYCFYRDDLCWHDLPVHPPWAKVKDPGKQPAVRKWWDFDPHDCNLDKYFNNDHPYNIGLAPTNGVVVVDLDSKPDQGASVQALLNERSDLAATPRHATRNGAHLVYICSDLPQFSYPNGSPYYKALTVGITSQVTAELFHSNHTNVVLPPSRHKLDDFIYHWTVFGEIPVVTWQWLQDTFGFRDPCEESSERGRKAKGSWHLQFKGDFASLDLVKLLEELGHSPLPAGADEGKYSILCPWNAEHSEKDTAAGSTSTVIWQPIDDGWPRFDCKHSHCAKRKLKELLEWAESKSSGIVDRHCARQRIWDRSAREHLGKNQLPRVLHAEARLESDVYREVGKIIGPHHVWFNRAGWIAYIEKVPSGFEYSSEPKGRYKITALSFGFRELSALRAKGMLEKYMEPGVLRQDDNGEQVFIPKSLPTDLCAGMVTSDQLRDQLDHISRILPVPLPVLMGNELVYPLKGYDPRFGTYLVPDSPELDHAMPIEEAWALIARILSGFCFTTEQSRTHAVARLLTPFARALLGWTTRVPLWPFIGSRPRCGKDYLSGCVLIIYEGFAFEDQPITGRDSAPETAKRILAAARAGRRFMHFSNCEQNLKDTSLTQAITDPMLSGRNLGTNDAKSDITVPNEMEYSVSFNLGLNIGEDLGPRSRPICLAFYEEDPNSRIFPDPHLHRTVKKNRARILSAFAAIFKVWAKEGFPKGTTPFASFVEWAEIIGGVMLANGQYMYGAFHPLPVEGIEQSKVARPPEGWGDPCLPWNDEFAESVADKRTSAMSALFIVCRIQFGDAWVKNKDIIACVAKYQASIGADDDEGPCDDQNAPEPSLNDARLDALSYFGRLDQDEDAHRNKGTLIRVLRAFRDRILAGIQLKIKPNSSKIRRDQYQFSEAQKPVSTPKNAPAAAENAPEAVPMSPLGGHFPIKHMRENHTTPYTSENKREGYSVKICRNENRKIGAKWSHGDTSALALDLETCAEVKVSKRGTPKITVTGEALNPWRGEIRLVSVADGEGAIESFDLRDGGGGALPPEIRTALERCPLIVHNACFDLLFLKVKLGIVPQKVFCTMTAARLLTPSRSESHTLGATLERYLDVKLPKEQGGSDWGAFVLTDAQIAYAHDDVRYLHRLEAILAIELKLSGLEEVFELEMKLVPIVVAMEEHGFAVDRARLQSLRSTAAAEAGRLRETLRKAFSQPTLNLDSPSQLLEAFKASNLDINATDETTLSACPDERARLIVDYRAQAKLEDSIKGLLKAVGDDGRIHARFSPMGALSGRFSSKNPNLQNVTRGALRSCFVASGEDRSLVVADYSQIELRIGAHFAGDEVMLDAFRAKQDLHRATAAAVLSKPPARVTSNNRQLAKAVNFGFLYGQRAEGFQQYARTQYGIVLSLQEAAELRDRFFARYRGLAKWHQEAWEAAHKGVREARTVLGRLLLEQGEGRDWDRFQLHTSYRVSGSAADVLKLAMVKSVAMLPTDVHMVATVHDELVFDSPSAQAAQYSDMIRMIMEEAFKEAFGPELPIEVEAKVCANWSAK